MLIVFLIVLACLLWLLLRRKPDKGERGEQRVARVLGETVVGKQYVVNDLLFADEKGASCQIDHVYINRYGIWVIETKNYAGRIFGSENEREWIQVLAYGEVKNRFYNPVKQNATHIYQLTKYLNRKYIFHNVVCFLDRADLSHVDARGVYSLYELSKIKRMQTDVRLSVEEMEGYYDALLNLKANSPITRKEHIENIHRMQDNLERGLCPRCGKELLIRKGKNGEFYGCSGFPDCKFTKNI